MRYCQAPLFENLVGGSIPQAERGFSHYIETMFVFSGGTALHFFSKNWFLKTKSSCCFSIAFMCCLIFTNFKFLFQKATLSCFAWWTIYVTFFNKRTVIKFILLQHFMKTVKIVSSIFKISFASFSFFDRRAGLFTYVSNNLAQL